MASCGTLSMTNGNCAEVPCLPQTLQPLLSCALRADSAIPKTVAPMHDLRARDVDSKTPIRVAVRPQHRTRGSLTPYSSGTLEWPASGFLDDRQRGAIDSTLAGLVVLAAVCALMLSGWLA